MNRKCNPIKHLAALAVTASMALAMAAWAHDDDLRSPNLKPRVGAMSEAVVRQKLATYGVKDVAEIKREGDHFQIQANYDGRPTLMTMHAQTGLLLDKASGARLAPLAGASTPMVREPQIKLRREELVRPEVVTAPR